MAIESLPEPHPTDLSFRNPSGEQLAQFGLLGWLIFSGVTVQLGFIAGFILSHSDLPTRFLTGLFTAAIVGAISGAFGAGALFLVGLPLSILLRRVLRSVRSRLVHATAYGLMALSISLAVNALLGWASVELTTTMTTMTTVATVVAWCLKWGRVPRLLRSRDRTVRRA